MKFETIHKPIKLMNLVSLLNIILLFFSVLMLTSYSMHSDNSSVKLNNSIDRINQPTSNNSTLTLTEHGLIFFDSEEISLPDLPEKLKMESKKHNSTINLFAEKNTKVDFIQEIIDISKSSGIENLLIRTEMVKLHAAQ